MRTALGRSVIGPVVAPALALPFVIAACVAYKTADDAQDAGLERDASPLEASTDAGADGPLDAGVHCTADPCVQQIAAGDFHTCALLADGTVRCWGRNASGELGQPITVERKYTKPTPVPSLSGILEIACGGASGLGHTCARTAAGEVVCWGGNKTLELGRSGPDATPDGAPASGVRDAVEITTRVSHVCARLADGGVVCWGLNATGELGRGPVMDGGSLLPGAVQSLPSAAIEVGAGADHTCVTLSDHTLACFGANAFGQLGSSNPKDYQWVPQRAPSIASVGQVLVGGSFTCALRQDTGDVACWGENRDGELGNGTLGDQDTHKRVHLPLDRKAVRIGGSLDSACAILDDGSLWCWGSNAFGQVGVPVSAGTAIATPVQVSGLPGAKVVDVVGGYSHTCALFEDGTVSCWGSNVWGELGRGDVVADGGVDQAPHPEPATVTF